LDVEHVDRRQTEAMDMLLRTLYGALESVDAELLRAARCTWQTASSCAQEREVAHSVARLAQVPGDVMHSRHRAAG
jgi:hypothetical protein